MHTLHIALQGSVILEIVAQALSLLREAPLLHTMQLGLRLRASCTMDGGAEALSVLRQAPLLHTLHLPPRRPQKTSMLVVLASPLAHPATYHVFQCPAKASTHRNGCGWFSPGAPRQSVAVTQYGVPSLCSAGGYRVTGPLQLWRTARVRCVHPLGVALGDFRCVPTGRGGGHRGAVDAAGPGPWGPPTACTRGGTPPPRPLQRQPPLPARPPPGCIGHPG